MNEYCDMIGGGEACKSWEVGAISRGGLVIAANLQGDLNGP